MASSLSTTNNYSKKYFKQALIVLFICSLFLIYKYIAQLFPSVISENLIKTNGLTGLKLAIMASSYYYSYSFVQILAGYIIDKRDVKIPCFLAILIISIAILAFTHTNNFYVMCLSRTLMGVGTSFATVMYMKCAASWASEKAFGVISSMLATVTMFGAAFGSAPIAYFFEQVGWHYGLELIAYIGIVLAILALFFVTNKGSRANVATNKANLKDFKAVLTNKDNWLLLFYSGFTFSPIIVIGGLWGNPFLIKKFGITNTQASMLLFMMFIGVGIGAPIWAVISAKLKSRKSLMHLANFIAGIAMVTAIYLPINYNFAMITFFSIGFAVGCFMICFQLCRQLNSVYTMGFAVAFMNMSDGIISSIIEPTIGYLLDLFKTGPTFTLHDYHIALAIIPICFILSSIFLLFIKTRESTMG